MPARFLARLPSELGHEGLVTTSRGPRSGALERLTCADLLQAERNANAAVDFDI